MRDFLVESNEPGTCTIDVTAVSMAMDDGGAERLQRD